MVVILLRGSFCDGGCLEEVLMVEIKNGGDGDGGSSDVVGDWGMELLVAAYSSTTIHLNWPHQPLPATWSRWRSSWPVCAMTSTTEGPPTLSISPPCVFTITISIN